MGDRRRADVMEYSLAPRTSWMGETIPVAKSELDFTCAALSGSWA